MFGHLYYFLTKFWVFEERGVFISCFKSFKVGEDSRVIVSETTLDALTEIA